MAPLLAIAGLATVSVCSRCWQTEKLTGEHAERRALQPPRGVEEWVRGDGFAVPPRRPPMPFGTALVAHRFDSWTYAEMNPRSARLGSVREGELLWGKRESSYRGCDAGWYALAQGGYACAGGSFRLADSWRATREDVRPALEAALPYRYVQVTTDGAPRYKRMPRPGELASDGRPPAAPVEVRMEGDYFLAVLGEEESHGRRFYRTLRNKYVRVEDVETLATTTLHGKRKPALPLAFVIDAEAPLLVSREGRLSEVGHAVRYSRFRLEQMLDWDGVSYAMGTEGHALPASSVRVARGQPRPSGVGEHEKWIVVTLSEQTLIAYEGDTPVLATLVSSGRESHETPTGAFRIRKKYISRTMQGEDPIDGHYEVQDVPWTMYYQGAYALHGAYWHDQFGRVKSHGCLNLAPADARWLLRWTDPPLPAGWHGVFARAPESGTRVYVVD